MAGRDCDNCGATMVACDKIIRELGHGCCEECFTSDTHGLLERFKVIDVADQQQEIENLTRLVAQQVIARGEHARAIMALRAEVNSMIEENALLRGRVQELEHISEYDYEVVRRTVLLGVMREVRKIVHDLPERVKILELCIEGIEKKFKLKRRPPEPARKALPPGRPTGTVEG